MLLGRPLLLVFCLVTSHQGREQVAQDGSHDFGVDLADVSQRHHATELGLRDGVLLDLTILVVDGVVMQHTQPQEIQGVFVLGLGAVGQLVDDGKDNKNCKVGKMAERMVL